MHIANQSFLYQCTVYIISITFSILNNHLTGPTSLDYYVDGQYITDFLQDHCKNEKRPRVQNAQKRQGIRGFNQVH